MGVNDFLQNLGMSQEKPDRWQEVIVPSSSYLIIGDVGTGKSGLAYYLLERFSKEYELIPATVGLPTTKADLLPSDFIMPTVKDLSTLENAIIFIDEAGLQLPIEDTKKRQTVIEFLSLPRQRNQILLMSFHFPRLILGRYLPYFSAFLLKRPPYLLEFAGKRQGDQLTEMMKKAEERFAELAQDDVVKHTYVIAPRLRWQGLLENPLPSFWTEDLSKIWAGVREVEGKQTMQYNLFGMGKSPSPQRRRYVTYGEEAPPEEFALIPQYEKGVIVGFEIADPTGSEIKQRSHIYKLIRKDYPGVSLADLENARFEYSDYYCTISLRR